MEGFEPQKLSLRCDTGLFNIIIYSNVRIKIVVLTIDLNRITSDVVGAI